MPEDRFPRAGRRWHKGWEEVVVAAILLVGALFFRLRLEGFVRGRRGAFLGPEFWPATLLSIAIVLSAIYLVLAIIWARRQSAELEAESATTTSATAPAATEPPTPSTGGSAVVSQEGHAGPDTSASPADATAPAEAESTGSAVKLVGGVVLLAAFIYLLGPIGFVPAAFLFSVAFMLLVGERRWWVLLLFPVVAVTILLGIFTQLLVVSLPRGTGIFIDLSTYLY